MLTRAELDEKLIHFDELTLLELLDITSEEIVDRFQDIIDEKFDKLANEVE